MKGKDLEALLYSSGGRVTARRRGRWVANLFLVPPEKRALFGDKVYPDGFFLDRLGGPPPTFKTETTSETASMIRRLSSVITISWPAKISWAMTLQLPSRVSSLLPIGGNSDASDS